MSWWSQYVQVISGERCMRGVLDALLNRRIPSPARSLPLNPPSRHKIHVRYELGMPGVTKTERTRARGAGAMGMEIRRTPNSGRVRRRRKKNVIQRRRSRQRCNNVPVHLGHQCRGRLLLIRWRWRRAGLYTPFSPPAGCRQTVCAE
ncbi:unnamed protein product [Sphacelaria rigidula]